MNFLKSMISAKKGELSSNNKNNKWVKQGDLNKQKEMEYLREQKEREEKK